MKAALIIAGSDYDDPRFAPLRAPRLDAEQLAQVLRDPAIGGFGDVRVLLNRPKLEIEESIEALLSDRRSDDLLLLHFSCHGVRDKAGRLHFATTGSRWNRLRSTSVSSSFVNEQLDLCRAGRKVLLLDCCFSGAFARGLAPRSSEDIGLQEAITSRGTVVFAATGTAGFAFERDGSEDNTDHPQLSLFTGAVVHGLKTGAADLNGDGHIDVQELVDYVTDRIREIAPEQQPTSFSTHVRGRILLARGCRPERPGGNGEASARALAPAVTADTARGEHADTAVSTVEPDDAAAPFDSGRWVRLLGYYADCVEQEAALEAIPTDAGNERYVISGGQELLLSGMADHLPADRQVLDLVGRAPDEEILYYGYPVIVFQDPAREAGRMAKGWRLAPLLLLEVALNDGPEGPRLSITSPKPALHPALHRACGLPLVEFRTLAEAYEPPWLGKDLPRMGAHIQDLLDRLGIRSVQPIEPTSLGTDLALQPIRAGARNSAIIFRGTSPQGPTTGLVKELRQLQRQPERMRDTALAALEHIGTHQIGPEATMPVVAPMELNDAQEGLLHSAMAARLTVATGPPGTGKSQLITNVIATAWPAQQSVLLASTNNKAVDVVVERANRVAPGLVIRTGNQQYREQAGDMIAALLANRHAEPNHATAGSTLRARRAAVEELRERLADVAEAEAELALLATRRKRLTGELGWTLGGLPTPLTDEQALGRWRTWTRWGLRYRRIGAWPRARIRSRLLLDPQPPALERLHRLLTYEIECRQALRRLAALAPTDELWEKLRSAEQEWHKASVALAIASAGDALHHGSMTIERLRRSWRTPSSSQRTFSEALNHLRAWATTTRSAARALPLTPGLFDLVVIDEASQVPIPDVLPLLYRAQRALIVGDPMQLEHIAKLPEIEERACRQRAGLSDAWLERRFLDYRAHSAYAALERTAGVPLLLDEHYRCHPDIIEIVNRPFYQGRLTVLTEPRNLRLTDPPTPAVRWIDAPGHVEHPPGGSAQNQPEAAAVVAAVQNLDLTLPRGATIGVVTPLKAQQLLLERQLQTVVPKNRELVVGTAHTFQGDECDAIVLSPVSSAGIRNQTRNWLCHEANLWNVAITRARAYLMVVGDQTHWASLDGVLSQLARTYSQNNRPDTPKEDPETLYRLHRALLEAGLSPRRSVLIGGYRCDFLIEDADRPTAILVDSGGDEGDPGRRLRQRLTRRDLVEHSGVSAILVPAWTCLERPERVAAWVIGRTRHA
jgi:hypothetical protein